MQSGKGTLFRRLFVWFFVFMLFCTAASRIYDSVTVPKVLTDTQKQAPVEQEIDGNGTIKEKQVVSVDVTAGLRVEAVPAIPGSVVKTGDTLFTYQLKSLMEKKEECGREIEKLKLNLESQKVSEEVYPSVSQSELAAFEVEMAQRELSQGKQDYEKAYEDYGTNLDKLKKDYEKKGEVTQEELWDQLNSQYESSRRALAQARRSRDQETRDAARKVDDLEEKLKGLQQEGNHDAQIQELEKELDRAKEDLDDLSDSWDRQVEDMEADVDEVDDRRGRISSGQTSSQDALKETYDAAVKQQEDLLKTAQKKVDTLQEALDRASFQASTAAKTDENTRLTNNQKKRLSKLTQKGIQLDLDAKDQEASHIEALIDAGGAVTAETDGTVVKQELQAGKTTTGEELLSIAVGPLQFEGSFVKDHQEMAVGDSLKIILPGTSRKVETKVARINLMGGEDGVFQADLENVQTTLGAAAHYECRKQSDLYNQVIPLSALRKDMKGYYCLVAQPRKSILGEEYRAQRVDVQLLYEGTREAAIDGPVHQEDMIIVRSNKVIGEGDRVRMVSEL